MSPITVLKNAKIALEFIALDSFHYPQQWTECNSRVPQKLAVVHRAIVDRVVAMLKRLSETLPTTRI